MKALQQTLLITLVPAMLCAGCGKDLGPELEGKLKDKPQAKERIKDIKVDRLEDQKQIITDILTFAVPHCWDLHKRKTDSDAQVRFQIEVKDRGEERLFESLALVELAGTDALFLNVEEVLSRYVSEPEKFISRYDTDLAFFEAVYNTIPASVRWARGSELRESKALLDLKLNESLLLSIPLPVRKVNGDSVTVLIGAEDEHHTAVAQVFDEAGNWRVYLAVGFDDAMTANEATMLLAQMLIDAELK